VSEGAVEKGWRGYGSPTLGLIESEIGLRLSYRIVKPERFDFTLPGWRVSCGGTANAQAKQDCAAHGRAGEIGGGSAHSPMYSRMWCTESPFVTQGVIRMSALQIGHTSGVDSCRRASKITHR